MNQGSGSSILSTSSRSTPVRVPNVLRSRKRLCKIPPPCRRISFQSTALLVIFPIVYILLCQTSLVLASSRKSPGGNIPLPPPPPPPPPPPSFFSRRKDKDHSRSTRSWGHFDDNGDDDDKEYNYKNNRYSAATNTRYDKEGEEYDEYYQRVERHYPRDRRTVPSRGTSRENQYQDIGDSRRRNYNERQPPPSPPSRRSTEWEPPLSSSSDASRKASSTMKSTKSKPTNFFNPFWKKTKLEDRPMDTGRMDDDAKTKRVDETRREKDTYTKAASTATTTTSYNPIDYQFPSKSVSTETSNTKQGPMELEEDIPLTGNTDERISDVSSYDANYKMQSVDHTSQKDMPRFASARQDAIARYRSTKMGKIRLGTSSFLVGSTIGGFVGQSIFNNGKMMALFCGFMFWIMSLLRNDYGEMSRSLGLGLIYLLQRTRGVRRQYRTGPHIRSMCRLGPRKPFPPLMEGGEENPWRYAPMSRDDPDFEMAKALLSVVLIGSICGGNVPLIPTWIGSAGGAAAFAIFGMGKNARGDLIRTMGMRVVALTGEAMRINADLRIASKVLIVSGKVFDKIMILDRKHRIKDRIVKGATMAYDMASRTFTSVQSDIQQGNGSSGDRYARGNDAEERRRTRPRS